MARARVANLEDGLFSAYVEYDDAGPFSFLNGPDRAPLHEAVGWARRHARVVVLRIGGISYSAGADAVPGMPVWTLSTREQALLLAGDGTAEQTPTVWRVEARTVWLGADRLAAARRLARSLADSAEIDSLSYAPTHGGFSIVFRITASGLLAARERASNELRDAWASSGIGGAPDGYDLASVSVTPAE